MGPVVKFTLLLLRGYQIFISPLLPHSCRFYPSCSEYACQALNKIRFWERPAAKLQTDYEMPSLSSGWSGPSALTFGQLHGLATELVEV